MDLFVQHSVQEWIVFHVIIIGLLALDLGVFNRKAHVIELKEAVLWSAFWISLGLLFGAWIWQDQGSKSGMEYLTGYAIEKSLSVDNLFVFLAIFSAYKIPRIHQHRLLYWGVLGAIILRAIFVFAGTALLAQFHWLIYVFGAFLIYTGFGIFRDQDKESDPRDSKIVQWSRKLLPFTDSPDHNGKFVMIENGKRVFTLMFLTLIFIELSDVVFALDSIPAIFGVTRDPYLVYTSNIFAILGLRSLFFVLEDFAERFYLLQKGVALVLIFIGGKMMAEIWYHVSPGLSLSIVGLFLAGSMVLSVLKPKHSPKL